MTATDPQMRLLIIEDDRESADYLAKAFREVGYVADLAGDGEEGLALAESGDYDVLVVDRMLPKRDGLSLIGSLRDKGGVTRGTDVPKLGLTLAPANSVAGAGKEGVVVTEVDPKSAAAERGFKEGDVILEVAGKSVTNAGDVREAINAARTDNKNSVLMRIKSGGSSRFVAVPLAKG